jgi:histidinol-phosphate/aromatic aminotransferase/cobyric acid decarboxylase-like protein
MYKELSGQGLMYYKDEANFIFIDQKNIKTLQDLKNIWEELTEIEIL